VTRLAGWNLSRQEEEGARYHRLCSKKRTPITLAVTPKGLLWLALLLVSAYALLTAEKPTPSNPDTACNEANALYNDGLYGEALQRYEELLQEPSPPPCAADGAMKVGKIRCLEANRLQEIGLEESASETYQRALDFAEDCPKGVGDPADLPINPATTFWEWATPPWADRVGRWLTRQLSTMEIFLIAALALTLWVHRRRLRRLRRSPIIEVVELENATGDELLDKTKSALTALLRERLSAAGIRPPTVPSGNVQESAITVIEQSPGAQAKFIAAFFKLLLAQITPRVGHKFTGTLVEREDGKFGVSFDLSEVYEGRTETIETEWRDDLEEAAEIAAARAYQRVIAALPDEEAIPGWMRWTGPGDSMRTYFRGQEAERNSDFKSALEAYKEAQAGANALPWMGRASIHVEQRQYLESLRLLLDTVLFWPDYRTARYRLAAMYSFSESWIEAWRKLKEREAQVLRDKIAAIEGELVPDQASTGWFLSRAVGQYRRTVCRIDERMKQLGPTPRWLTHRLARWPAAFPIGLARLRDMRRERTTAVTAMLCSQLQAGGMLASSKMLSRKS
jgi:tetratricopeptide (TPR) repeat protein